MIKVTRNLLMNLINFLENHFVCLYALGVGSIHEQAELNKELVNGISVYTMELLQHISVTVFMEND